MTIQIEYLLDRSIRDETKGEAGELSPERWAKTADVKERPKYLQGFLSCQNKEGLTE